MNSNELAVLLAQEGFNPLCYRIESASAGTGQDDCYCLRRSGSSWKVCYLERGSIETLGTFATESAACADFLGRLEKEPGLRSHLLAWFSERAKADDFVAVLLQAGIKPTHRDAPAFAHKSDTRYRVFVDGRDLQRAQGLCDEILGSAWKR